MQSEVKETINQGVAEKTPSPRPVLMCLVLSSVRGEQQQNPYCQDTLHLPPAQPFCKIGILMTIAAVGTAARSIRQERTPRRTQITTAVRLSVSALPRLTPCRTLIDKGAQARALPHSASAMPNPSPPSPPQPRNHPPQTLLK